MRGIVNRKYTFKLIILTLCLIILLGIYSLFRIINSNLIYEGIKVDEFNVSNMTKEAAVKLLKDKKENMKKRSIKLMYNDMEYNFSIEDLEFKFLYQEAVNEAYRIGREGNIFKRLLDIIKIRYKGVKIDLKFVYNKDIIQQIVEEVSSEINVEAKDAEFHINNGNIYITDEVVGKSVNKDELIKTIEENLLTANTIKIPVESTMPKLSKSLLSRINGIIGEYSTSFLGSSPNRIENIRLSAESINGTILLPGQIMSFNEVTGPIREEFGYKDATVIVGGQYTSGVGGGVCQTSTTLYNALILAGVTILERSPHSIPPRYVDLGRDAAVAENLLDLKFRNDFDYPIYIATETKNNRIFVYIYGDISHRDYIVKIESEVIETIKPGEEHIVDEKLKAGEKVLVQEGRNGYKVRTYRYIIKDGIIVDKEIISTDYYKEKNYIYKIGR